MPYAANDSLFLLRAVLTAHWLMHLLRYTLCIDSPVQPLHDAVAIRKSLSATLKIDLDDIRWSQASLPIRSGRLWCCFADTVCRFGFSRKHHGAHFPLHPARLRAVKD